MYLCMKFDDTNSKLTYIIKQCMLPRKVYQNINHCSLRFYKTAITWLRSLSAILPLFWHHDMAEFHRLCREDLRNVLWRHEIHDVFPRIMTYALQNVQISQCFTTKFNIFSLNLTGEFDFLFHLLVRKKKNFLWVVLHVIWFEWSDFLLWWIIWFEHFHFVAICSKGHRKSLSFYAFLSIWKKPLFHQTWPWS